jgi:ubiquinol-cytochrome c reductase iron-sulfur subunit
MTRLLERLLLAMLRFVRRRRRAESPPPDPTYGNEPTQSIEQAAGAGRSTESDPRAELGVVAALLGTGVLGLGFIVIYALDAADTQLLGATGGLALLSLAIGLILAGASVFPQETAVEPRPRLSEGREPLEREVAAIAGSAADGVSRRRLLLGAAGIAGAGLGGAALVPLDSLGPNVGQTIDTTPWRPGTVLVDDAARPLSASAVVEGSFVTAFPQGADKRQLGSSIVVVRVDPTTLALPAARAGWAPEGILAYSKICTHAGCAVALYRAPLNEQTSTSPALVCPCHYSTFDVRRAAAVEFGPAGRPLPQLPLAIRSDGVLVAAGGFSGPIGPSWWSVRREGPTRPA